MEAIPKNIWNFASFLWKFHAFEIKEQLKYARKKSQSLLDVEDTFFHITDMILGTSWWTCS